jgi:hypothetical protein
VQNVLVTEADASKVMAENAYQVAKERSEKAEANAKRWKEYVSAKKTTSLSPRFHMLT